MDSSEIAGINIMSTISLIYGVLFSSGVHTLSHTIVSNVIPSTVPYSAHIITCIIFQLRYIYKLSQSLFNNSNERSMLSMKQTILATDYIINVSFLIGCSIYESGYLLYKGLPVTALIGLSQYMLEYVSFFMYHTHKININTFSLILLINLTEVFNIFYRYSVISILTNTLINLLFFTKDTILYQTNIITILSLFLLLCIMTGYDISKNVINKKFNKYSLMVSIIIYCLSIGYMSNDISSGNADKYMKFYY